MPEDNKIKVVVILVLALLVLALVSYFIISNKKNDIKTETAEIFTNKEGGEPYSDLNGNPVTLNEYLGKVLVVATWASWSPFSQADLEMMNKLATDYDSSKVVFLAINRKETKEQAGRYLSTLPELSKLVMVLDPNDQFYGAVGGYTMPEVVVYSETGDVVLHSRGVANKDEIKKVIEAELSPE